MDAGGLAHPDDLASMSACRLLPDNAIIRQIALREKVAANTTSMFLRLRALREVAELREMQAHEVRLRLSLNHGSFVVLSAGGIVHTCYTDRTDTSRSSACEIDELVAFAKSVLQQFGEKPVEGV